MFFKSSESVSYFTIAIQHNNAVCVHKPLIYVNKITEKSCNIEKLIEKFALL